MNLSKQLRQYINTDDSIYIAPGVFDGLSTRLVEQANFPLVYASGGAIARSCGIPDIGLLSLTEVVDRLRLITSVCNIPVIADADTGFGNAINTQRTVTLFEQAGVAGLHLEDQVFPKRCGHLANKSIIPTAEMVQKITIAKRSQTNDDFVIIARTDAIAVEGFDSAIERALAYSAAGADMLFVEAPTSRKQIETIAEKIAKPKLINMFYGGKTPLIPLNDLKMMGYRVVIIPSDLQRAAIQAMQNTLKTIAANGDSQTIQAQLASFNEREQIVATQEYLAIDQKT